MPSFLTAQDEEQLNATYSKLKEEGMRSMMDSFNKGEILNVTLDEATKIVEYAVETEVCQQDNIVYCNLLLCLKILMYPNNHLL